MLKHSKINIEYSKVQIIPIAICKNICSIAILCQLFLINSQPLNALQF